MNTPSYTAVMKVEKWRKTPRRAVSWPDEFEIDMRLIREVISTQADEIRRLKISRAMLGKPEAPTKSLGRGSVISGTPAQLAEAVCSTDAAVDVYQFETGSITWRKRGGKAPAGGEFIGSYSEGADFRDVLRDFQALAA